MNNNEDNVGCFDRRLISLMKLHGSRIKAINFSEIEQCCLDRYNWERDCLKGKKND